MQRWSQVTHHQLASPCHSTASLWMLPGDAIQSLRRLLDIHLWVDQHIQDYDRITWFSHTPYTDPSKASIWGGQSDALGSISLEAASIWFILCILHIPGTCWSSTFGIQPSKRWPFTIQSKSFGFQVRTYFQTCCARRLEALRTSSTRRSFKSVCIGFPTLVATFLSQSLDPLRDSLLDYWLTNSRTCFWFSWLASLFVHSSIPRFGGNNWFRCGTEHLCNLAVKRSLAM